MPVYIKIANQILNSPIVKSFHLYPPPDSLSKHINWYFELLFLFVQEKKKDKKLSKVIINEIDIP